MALDDYAFPQPYIAVAAAGSTINAPLPADSPSPGMSLRDWFAATIHVDESDWPCTQDACESLIGRKKPEPYGQRASLIWCADVECAVRYIKADAMLRARKSHSPKGD